METEQTLERHQEAQDSLETLEAEASLDALEQTLERHQAPEDSLESQDSLAPLEPLERPRSRSVPAESLEPLERPTSVPGKSLEPLERPSVPPSLQPRGARPPSCRHRRLSDGASAEHA